MSDDDLILATNYVPPLDEFLSALRIQPSGLGAQLFTAVHRQLFVSSRDLKEEYERYYCVEYTSLRAFLETAHEIFLEPIELEKRHILKIKSPSGVVDQAYDDNVLSAVVDCIRKMEEAHEDKDGLRIE